ncbi:hypothetical protein AB0G85_33405 [Streptomyces sioyaensis]|uniref:hypothetical protein n=1 Tax=Streptomyces sioyaensis TaxID=67364 RepID=UPI0033CDF612
MFGRKSQEERAYNEKSKAFGGCPPCDDCDGSGEDSKSSTGCDPCDSTGIDIGPRGRARSQSRKR